MARPINLLAIARLEDDEVQAIREVGRDITVRCSVNREETARLLPEVEVLLASSRLDIDAALAPRLKWVHFLSAGVDHFFRCRHCPHQLAWDGQRMNNAQPCSSVEGHSPLMNLPQGNIVITTSSGVAAIPIAEYVLTTMLFFARKMPRLLQAQTEHRWIKQSMMRSDELYGATLGIVGPGHIGGRVAELARALGMRVLATRRSATGIIAGAAAAPAETLYPVENLDQMLAVCDYVLLSVPLTPETEGLIDEGRLRAMKRSGVLINISRGRVVDEVALMRALRDGWIAGAALDVATQEPLDPASPLWDVPNLLFTPHIAAITEHYSTRAVGMFCDNLRRYVAGQPMVNMLDRARGY